LRVITLLVLISQSSSSAHFSDWKSAPSSLPIFWCISLFVEQLHFQTLKFSTKMYFPVNRKNCATEKACFQL
jgi:hypothetical protein